MSKKNNNNQHLKQRIREQQAEIDALKRHTNDLRNIIRDMRENKFATYSEVMLLHDTQVLNVDDIYGWT